MRAYKKNFKLHKAQLSQNESVCESGKDSLKIKNCFELLTLLDSLES